MPKAKRQTVDETLIDGDEEPEQVERILYDPREPQAIPINLRFKGRPARVVHHLRPLTDQRFFQFQEDIERTLKSRLISSDQYKPKISLWSDLVESREGYKESPDWKRTAKIEHSVAVINALCTINILDDSEVAPDQGADGLFDEAGTTTIHFRTMQSGALLTLSHTFKRESKADTDEFVSITTNEANPNALASAQALSKAERLYRVGRRLLVEHEGYASDCEVPAVHLAETTYYYLITQAAVMGKGLAV